MRIGKDGGNSTVTRLVCHDLPCCQVRLCQPKRRVRNLNYYCKLNGARGRVEESGTKRTEWRENGSTTITPSLPGGPKRDHAHTEPHSGSNLR